MAAPEEHGPWGALAGFFLRRRLLTLLLAAGVLLGGLATAPFDWELGGLPRDPVPVDAIPDLGENQQIVFSEWPGHSPQDVEDQLTYPLTVSLLGVPGVQTIRSTSMFGFSSIYVIFEEGTDFYWSRSRLLEKLSSLPAGLLPEGVSPALGPDATALGQVFWYTIEGRDAQGEVAGGWELHELRSVQDFNVRYALMSVPGVAEVASVGGHVREYQVDVDPDALQAWGVTLEDVYSAVRMSNREVGAQTLEINRVEYVVRGVGFLRSLDDLRRAVVTVRDDTPVYVENVAHVSLGPAPRRGALDKNGVEAVGGVVVVRHGENPLAVIERVKERIAEIAPGLPSRTLEDGSRSQLTIVPFYDRTGLIHETLGTLEEALRLELLVTVLVVLVMLARLSSALLVAALLPLAVLMSFVLMRWVGIDANIVSLTGIAIAIGTMVDMGIIVTENCVRHLDEAPPDAPRGPVLRRAVAEVSGAVVTAVLTTVVGFLPVFGLQAAEGKLFKPLAWTKTFALLSALLLALTVLPGFVAMVYGGGRPRWWPRRGAGGPAGPGWAAWLRRWWLVVAVGLLLAWQWRPGGPGTPFILNLLGVLFALGGGLLLFHLFQRHYEATLGWCLRHKAKFLLLPGLLVLWGLLAWLGLPRFTGWMPDALRLSPPVVALNHSFPGLGKEFMPPLDEGSFLYMPTTMPHASMGEALEVLQTLDLLIEQVPEVSGVVGKLGRAESALDPAPISMIESVVHYHPEWGEDEQGEPVRLWRDHIQSPQDIWDEIVAVAQIPGTTSAPRLQPIETRLVMLQSGMRAPMGVKVFGPDLAAIEEVGLRVQEYLRQVPQVARESVVADRIVGKPYLEIHIDREQAARYGVTVAQVQEIIEVAIGGKPLTRTVEGRERYPVRVRYPRELRDGLDRLGEVLVPTARGGQVPLVQLADIEYVRGPMAIKSEDTFLVGYVTFGGSGQHAEVEVVEAARDFLQGKLDSGEWELPAGVSYRFAGSYENQVRSEARLRVLLPVVLAVIFLLLYFQFGRASTAFMVFTGVFVAWGGGFALVWLYGQEWFLWLPLVGDGLRELFQVHPMNLSVAVWVGFIALFGVAVDDGVVMGSYLDQEFRRVRPGDVAGIREATLRAGLRRIRPCLMTVATTVLALLPVLTSTGRGSDIMVPMAVPLFGGMLFALITVLVVPVLYCWARERELPR